MGGQSSKMGYQRLVNNNNSNRPLFGPNAEFNPEFPQPAPKSINNLARNRRMEALKKKQNAEFEALGKNQGTGNITKTIRNSASQIPGIAFGTRRQVVPLRGGKKKSRRASRKRR